MVVRLTKLMVSGIFGEFNDVQRFAQDGRFGEGIYSRYVWTHGMYFTQYYGQFLVRMMFECEI